VKLEKDCLGDGLSIYESKTEKAKRILGSIGGGVARQQKMQEPLLQFKAGTKRV